ncbi:MAG: hypothetical protein QG579_494 [Patescibacteria group bacterium]|nr:hypothetical protein [Patescibacteria group bacterium]
MKTFCFLLVVLMASIFWGMYLSATYKYQYTLNSIENNVQTAPATNTETTESNTPAVTVVTPKPITTTPATQTEKPPIPVVAKLKCGNGGACKVADITPHDTQGDCWVYLSPINKVYNVTEYVSNPKEHPGGDVIVPYCGTNIYDVFIKKAGGHAHSSKALQTVLETYYIAPFES